MIEKYLDMNIPIKYLRLYTRLRGGLLPVEVNLGRWNKPKINYENRTCKLCNLDQIEDENHVIFICPVWTTYRSQLRDYQCFKSGNLELLLNSDDETLIIHHC